MKECGSFKELRDKYLDLAKIYHPDSGDRGANAEKFSELQEAYKVVHAHIQNQSETDLYEEVDDEEFESDHVAPQHRQFLNFGGFGFGPPSQREKVYRKQKVLKAHEKVVNHKVKRHAQSGTDGKSLTLRQKRAVKKNKVTNAIERLVEDLIQESMAKGDFDNLPRKGQPLPSKTQYCPFIDISQHNLNQVLVNNGVVPEFVALEKEIRDLLADSKTELLKARLKLGPEPLNSFNKKKWDGLLLNFEESVKMINRKVRQFNLVVPLLRMQKVQISAEKEVKKVVEKYEQKLEEMNTLEESETELAKTENTTLVYAFLNQVTEKVFSRIFKQSFGRD
ncbi:DnaJ-like subfamily C member 28 [Holothuria leucospilota]|uniref:DnaJ-like subfamily C member 28 n=1 Tax=Holothuria leucospilota TaxID=206669 RepID=A0A9Q1C812_HOLLE|nr:DnaJ-like subfamily C member 28 [Holothuria leucospilota]